MKSGSGEEKKMAGILEVCADSMESALAAERGGADRIELCGNLVIGGTTPSQALFEKICKETSLKIRVLLRPRFGDFCYSQNEYERRGKVVSAAGGRRDCDRLPESGWFPEHGADAGVDRGGRRYGCGSASRF